MTVLLVAACVFTALASAAADEVRCDAAQTTYTGVFGEAHVYMPASSDPFWSINCQMSRGASGTGVKALQIALNRCYQKSLTVDGQFGPRTQTALSEVQRARGLATNIGRYTDRDAWGMRFWGLRGVYLVCARMDGPILG